MDNAFAACSEEDDFVIESSQVPNLRVRKRQICYRESDVLSAKKKKPSVDLFKNQEKLVAQYIFQQDATAQQEEAELDRLLDGFRASYEAASKKVANTPYSPEMH
ncbi:hypothetical protein AND_009376 [Anopheles darlingi]|uniref:Uncharacterized protein n=1 Tax=Anopheles darlingi TaxID=43151 RepID=W5J876_ANODA|nr:hypothetical protein AND_009376 [Anopheles darlingi]